MLCPVGPKLRILFLGGVVGACSGNTTHNGSSSTDTTTTTGSTLTANPSTESSASTGSTDGSSSSTTNGGPTTSSAVGTGGTGSTGGTGGTGSTGSTGGTTDSGTGGGTSSGASGAAGSEGECTDPNPAGCRNQTCPNGQTCAMTSGRCIPSSCTCEGGKWVCTRDCAGGVCVDGASCTEPKPDGCFNDLECPAGESCIPSPGDVCLQGGCVCDSFNDEWVCSDECAVGTCGAAQCPTGCEPSAETFCGDDGITWVCGAAGAQYDPNALLDGGCTDLATQIPRYCCPKTFHPECQ